MTTTRFYKRPSSVRRRLYDPFIRVLIDRYGFTGLSRKSDDTVEVLAVQGRRTGRWHRNPVAVCVFEGKQHVLSVYGESEWTRNLRHGMPARLQTREKDREIDIVELDGQEKADFMRFVLKRYRIIAKLWMKVNPDKLQDGDLKSLLDRYPVFRIESTDAA